MLGMGLGLTLGNNVAAVSGGGGGGGGSTWSSDPALSSTEWVLTNSNNTATRSGGTAGTNALVQDATARTNACFEVTVNALAGGNVTIGLWDGTAATADYVHDHGVSYRANAGFVSYDNSFLWSGSTYTDGNKIGVCLKNGKAYFAKDGTWQNGANPSAETGGIDVSATMAAGGHPAVSSADIGTQVTLNTAGPFMFALPTGTTAWN